MKKLAGRWASIWLCLLGIGIPSAAHALRCGGDPTDAAAVSAAREELKSSCNCSAVATRATYLKCVALSLRSAVQAGRLPRRCKAQVTRCARRSVIGRPGKVVCCRTDSRGQTRGRIVKDAGACQAPLNGSACVSDAASICDGCEAAGCVPPSPTPTPEATATPTVEVCPQGANLPPLASAPAKVLAGTSDCGGVALQPNAAPPYVGAIYDPNGQKLGDLGLGCQYVGPSAPMKIPEGGTSMMAVVGVTTSGVTLAGAGTDPNTCTVGAAMTSHCLNTSPGTDGMGACTTNADCGGEAGSCGRDVNCYFGAPVPVPGDVPVCVVNGLLDDLCGHVDFSGTTSLRLHLSTRIYAATRPDAICPLCVDGQCDSGENTGASCTASVLGTSPSCPPARIRFATGIEVPLRELSTGASELQASHGFFCPVAPTPTPDSAHRYCVKPTPTPSAFGIANAALIEVSGQSLGSSGLTMDMNLAGVFCIPPAGSFLDLAFVGPGVVSVKSQIDLTSILSIPGLPPLSLP